MFERDNDVDYGVNRLYSDKPNKVSSRLVQPFVETKRVKIRTIQISHNLPFNLNFKLIKVVHRALQRYSGGCNYFLR